MNIWVGIIGGIFITVVVCLGPMGIIALIDYCKTLRRPK